MDLIILFILIIIIVIASKKQEREERDKFIEENKQTRLRYAHQGNKSILEKCGKTDFIKFFGQEQYDKIMTGIDIEIVKMLPEYKK